MPDRIKFSAFLTLDYVCNEPENKLFDRKSVHVRPAALAELISAFANAEGGVVAIGISDKSKRLEGIGCLTPEKLNLLLNAPKDCCKPTPHYWCEYLDIINTKGENDKILLLCVEPENERIIATQNDSVYLRIGDKTREIKGEDLRMLEYSKQLRKYEDECNPDAELEDLDRVLLTAYKEKLNASHLTDEEVLTARGFMKKKQGRKMLTNAALLLFARTTMQFFPHCRIRITKYQGKERETGTRSNIIKDVNFDLPIPLLLEKTRDFVSAQLRDFTALNPITSLFETESEYPEFAWTELIVNAVTHREYAMEGAYIQVNIFDNRLEVISPGALPNIVTLKNMLYTRFSRNARIARALTDFGWVRELNEGVRRIYEDMKAAKLSEPQYSEPGNQYVKAILENNADIRSLRTLDSAARSISPEIWLSLDELEKELLVLLSSRSTLAMKQMVDETGRSAPTIQKRIKHLMGLRLVSCSASSPNDPKKTYTLSL